MHLRAECFLLVLGVKPPEQFSREVLMQKRGSPGRRWKRGGLLCCARLVRSRPHIGWFYRHTVRAHASMTHTRRDQARQSLILI
jgi:hypothetical protein